MFTNLESRITDFKLRMEIELDYCHHLFHYSTVRLLALKYWYYVKSETIVDDIAYDLEEKSWYVMGRALDLVDKEDISPCVDFDESHPLAEEAIQYANTLRPKN